MDFSFDPLAMAASLYGTSQAASSAKSANRMAQEEAGYSRQFVMDQMKSRHQWEVEDLERAGLNPVLSAGAAPSMGGSPQAQVFDESANAGSVGSSAVQAALASAQLKNIKEDTKKKAAEEDLTRELKQKAITDGVVSQETAYNLYAQREGIHANTAESLARGQILDYQKSGAKLQSQWDSSKIGKFFKGVSEAAKSVNPFTPSYSQSHVTKGR